MHARLLLAAIVFPLVNLTAQPQGAAARSGPTPTARSDSTRRDQARGRSSSIERKRCDVTTAKSPGVGIRERVRSAAFVGLPDAGAGAPDAGSLLPGGFSPYPMPGGVARAMYAEPGERVYFPRRDETGLAHGAARGSLPTCRS